MKNKRIWVFGGKLLVLCLLTGFFFCQSAMAAPKTIKWVMQSNYPFTAPFGKFYAVDFVKWVDEITDGRLKIELHPPGTFAKAADLLPTVSKGVIDAATDFGGYYTSTVPLSNVETGLPMAWDRFVAPYDAYYNRGLLALIREAYAKKYKTFPLALMNMAAPYHFGTTFPFKSLDDIKGKKIRAVGVYADYVKALGGTPVVVSMSEVYMALKTGMIDGLIKVVGDLKSIKLAEVLKSYVIEPTVSPVCSAGPHINLNSWNKLPPDIKRVIENNIRSFAAEATLKNAKYMQDAISFGEKNGVKFVTLSPDDTKKARKICTSLWDKVAAKDPVAAKGVEIVKKQLRDYGQLD